MKKKRKTLRNPNFGGIFGYHNKEEYEAALARITDGCPPGEIISALIMGYEKSRSGVIIANIKEKLENHFKKCVCGEVLTSLMKASCLNKQAT